MDYTTIRVPRYSRERLGVLAQLDGKTVSSKIVDLIDSAVAAAGLAVPSNAVSMAPWGTSFLVGLFGDAYRVALSRQGVQDLAADLETIADRGGFTVNVDEDYVVGRQGPGLTLEIEAFAKNEGEACDARLRLKKTMSADVAREVARGLLAGLPAEAAA